MFCIFIHVFSISFMIHYALFIYMQLDGVNSLLLTVALFVGPDSLCLLLRPSWDQMALIHLRGDVVAPLHRDNNLAWG